MKPKFKVGDIIKTSLAVSLEGTRFILKHNILGLVKDMGFVKSKNTETIYILRTKKTKECTHFVAKESSLKKATKEEVKKLEGDIVLEEL